MKTIIRILILLVFVSALAGCRSLEDQANAAFSKSVEWLWEQQDADGGWHSQTHAVLRDGKALTPYILYYLLQVPDEVYRKPAAGVEQGIAFIRKEIMASLTMSPDSQHVLNYPNYSAAYALRVLVMMNRDSILQDLLTEHLLQQQFAEHRGITSDHLAYGGWGYGEPGLPFGQHGHVDISHTRRIVEALMFEVEEEAKAEAKAKDGSAGDHSPYSPHHRSPHHRSPIPSSPITRSQITDKVQFFLKGAQRSPEDVRLYDGCISRSALPYDGGFISSAVTLSTNKSIPVFIEGAGYHYPSYATATCDGLLAMHALGMDHTTAYLDAASWLRTHQEMSTIEGLSPDDPEQWHQVMHYYHLAVRSEAMSAAVIKGVWYRSILKILVQEQYPEGYYLNPIGGVNKEDDPLMATILAVQALHFLWVENLPK